MPPKGFYGDNRPDYSTQFSPRESLEHEWDVEATKVANEHEITVARLNVEAKRELVLLQREDAVKSRTHAEKMAETDLAIKKLDVTMRTWFRIPILILKLPLLVLLGLAYLASVATGHEITSRDFWHFINN
jgi:hypothetical protein